MEQLLRITSTPIKYELEVEHPKLEIKRENPSASVDTKPAKLGFLGVSCAHTDVANATAANNRISFFMVNNI